MHFEFQSGNDLEKIYKKEELIKGEFSFTNEEALDVVIVAGGISSYQRTPTVFINGDEISYEDFINTSREDYQIFYFYGDIAKTIYRDYSKDGLILLYSK